MKDYWRLQTPYQTDDICAQIDALLWRRPYSDVATREPSLDYIQPRWPARQVTYYAATPWWRPWR